MVQTAVFAFGRTWVRRRERARMRSESVIVFGRYPRVSVLGAGLAVLLAALGGLVGGPPTELWHVVVASAAAVLPGAVLASRNDGLLVCWLLAAAPAFGAALRVGGAAAVAGRTALVVGLLAGTVAYLLGVGGRWVAAGGRAVVAA